MDKDRETEDCPDCAGRPGTTCQTCYGAGYVFHPECTLRRKIEKECTDELEAGVQRIIEAAANGHTLVAGPETARRLNEAFEKRGLPYEVWSFSSIAEGEFYAFAPSPQCGDLA